MQLMAEALGGVVEPSSKREYGAASVVVDDKGSIFGRMPDQMPVWMSHGDRITSPPPGFHVLAHSGNSPVAAMGDDRGRVGIQFHPEVVHTPHGREILRNFLYEVCDCAGTGSRPASSRRRSSRSVPRSAPAASSAPSAGR